MMTTRKLAATKSLFSALSIAILATLPATANNTNVQIAGHTVIVNRAGSNAMSVDQRTAAIQRELDNALLTAADHSAASVKVKRVNGQPVITLGGITIVTVNRANAKIAGTTPLALANKWSAAMRRELGNTGEVENYIANLGNTPSASDAPSAENYLVNSGGNNALATSMPAPASPQPAASRGPVNALASPQAFNSGNIGQDIARTSSPVQTVQTMVGLQAPPARPLLESRVIFVPAGITIPVTLKTGVSSATAQGGDIIEATLDQEITLDNGVIPAGTVVQGVVTGAEPGRRLDRSGSLGIEFNTIRLPDGYQLPIHSHIVGNIGKYADHGDDNSGMLHGESMKNKFESAAIRGTLGAGSGAALGTAVGAIAGGGDGAGKGAWSGAAIGGALGLADSILARKAADVVLKSGTRIELQIDQPLRIAAPPVPPVQSL